MQIKKKTLFNFQNDASTNSTDDPSLNDENVSEAACQRVD